MFSCTGLGSGDDFCRELLSTVTMTGSSLSPAAAAPFGVLGGLAAQRCIQTGTKFSFACKF